MGLNQFYTGNFELQQLELCIPEVCKVTHEFEMFPSIEIMVKILARLLSQAGPQKPI